jgi:tetratricopeptide (TPR) repeat protein
MVRTLAIIITFSLFWMLVVPTFAQEIVVTPEAPPADLPANAYIEGLDMIWQDLNRCSAAAFTIQLSQFDAFTDDYSAIVKRLNPNIEDVSVRVEEMIIVAEEYGLTGIVRRGGTLLMLKKLVAAGFPVLIENSYYEGANGWNDWMSHNRVLVGYDDATQELLFLDSLLGNGDDDKGKRLKYDDVEERWRAFNRNYLVLYHPEQESALQAVLGPQWDTQYNAQWTLQQNEDELITDKADSFTIFNKAWALLQLGRYEEAATAYDEARNLGLPRRMFWYDFGALEAYLAVGRYDDVITIVRDTLQDTPGVEELYFYIALAYYGQGNTDRAIANLEAALFRNRFYTEAQTQLTEWTTGS